MAPEPGEFRLHAPDGAFPRLGGEFVLYWIQATQRTHHNFALDFAVRQADALGLPVLAYFGLRHDYPWASDRLHAFILQSAAGLARSFARLGIQFAFALDQGPAAQSAARGESPLVQLARRSALVVTDLFPTFIQPAQTTALRRRVDTPIVALDSCTVVPLAFHERQHKTVGTFRRDVLEAYDHFLTDLPPERGPRITRRIELPFDPVDLSGSDPARLIAACPIDHTVAPVAEFPGGTAAGRRRLTEFLEQGLDGYAERKGEEADDRTSRLSPWLHFGNLSPHEVLLAARERAAPPDYLAFRNELLVWRELFHQMAWQDPAHTTPGAIPEWARRELRSHESDSRPAIYRLDQLERAATDYPAWNACQRQYLERGWMPNRLRMRWGKALIQWTHTHEDAFHAAVHLNNRYALDGRDPSSYGNILWLFGKFDRPFYRRKIYGTVRYMKLE